MTPQPTGERMVWLVPSERTPGQSYRVDLTANGGFGECSCIDWSTRRGLAIKAGAGEMGTRETACKHVLRTRRHFLNELLAAMAASECEVPR